MGGAHSLATTDPQTKEKVEKLFRQNNRSNRSRSLDNRQARPPTRPVGGSHSAKYPKQRCLTNYVPRYEESVDTAGGLISGLTRDEKRLLETCWFKCSTKQIRKCSQDIFYEILHTDEDLLRLFRLDHVPTNKLKDNDYFRRHSANLALVLNLVVTSLEENLEQAHDALQALGQQHVSLFDKTAFQSMYWDIFTDCFERNPPPSFRKGPEREAWSRMILFIIAQMKDGYQKAAHEKRVDRLSVPHFA